MGLSTPLALFGLLGLALPILAHFVRSRRLPEQSFPAMILLARADQAQRHRSALTDALLLLLRVLTIVALTLGLAGPRVPVTGRSAGAPEELVVVFDDSLSMTRDDGSATPVERAQAALRAELADLPADSQVSLIMAGEPAWVALPAGSAPSDVEAATHRRSRVRGGDFPKALELARRELASSAHRRRHALVLSDMARHSRASSVDWTALGVPVHFVDTAEAASAATNRRLTAADLTLDHDQASIRVTARGITTDTAVVVSSAGHVWTRGVLAAGAGESHVTLRVPLPEATLTPLEIALEGEDVIAADDHWPLWLRSREDVALLIVDGQPDPTGRRGEASFVTRALDAGRTVGAPSYRVVDEVALERLSPGDHAAVILAGALPTRRGALALRRFVMAGGGLWVAPSPQLAWRTSNSRLLGLLPARFGPARSTDEERPIVTEQAGLRSEDLVGTRAGPALTLSELSTRAHVWLRRGGPLMVEGPLGQGRVLMLGAPLGDRLGDLPFQPGYLPLVLRACERLVGAHASRGRIVAAGEVMHLPSEPTSTLRVESPGGALDGPGPEGRFRHTGGVGLYRVRDDEGARPELAFAVIPPHGEGDFTPGSTPDDISLPTTESGGAVPRSKPLAPWFYLFAGLLVAAEGVLRASRRSHGTRSAR